MVTIGNHSRSEVYCEMQELVRRVPDPAPVQCISGLVSWTWAVFRQTFAPVQLNPFQGLADELFVPPKFFQGRFRNKMEGKRAATLGELGRSEHVAHHGSGLL